MKIDWYAARVIGSELPGTSAEAIPAVRNSVKENLCKLSPISLVEMAPLVCEAKSSCLRVRLPKSTLLTFDNEGWKHRICL